MQSAPLFLVETLNKAAFSALNDHLIYKPVFYRLHIEKEAQELSVLLQQKPHIKVYNTIIYQLNELIKLRNPARALSPEEVQQEVNQLLNGVPLDLYGVWVYYPWNEKLVHLPPEEVFVELRTSRNQYKITPAERSILAGKRVGVIGLSVGQSVSLTLAMERSLGELRIADFDELEITNLNRLRSGVYNMGVKKTVLVAREIAEIDPFLKVTCFHEGITDNNMETFLLENGKLDVLIDECDSVDIKINCRVVARKHRIPVLMEASDRGTIDIERFDLEPQRPILHGAVDHLDVSKVKELKTNAEKLPYIMPIVGIETMSPRLKASAIEIGQTISTWPQLASAVTFGGGITADICRRVLLDQLHQSGRYFIDLDELISDPAKPEPELETYEHIHHLSRTDIITLAQQIPAAAIENTVTDEAIIRQLVTAAGLAPSAGNTQPWQWYFDGKRLVLFKENERAASYADLGNMATYPALGAALENLSLKAVSMGLQTTVQLFPLKAQTDNPVACVYITRQNGLPADDLVNYIGTRCTNRNLGTGKPIDAAVIEAIRQSIAPVSGASLQLFQKPEELAELAHIIGVAERLRLFIPQGHYDLFNRELRYTTEEEGYAKEGLDMRSLGLPPAAEMVFTILKDRRALDLLREWKLGSALEGMGRYGTLTAGAVGIVTMPGYSGEDMINGGRAIQRIWLTANKNQVALQPMMAPLFHFAQLNRNNSWGMPEQVKQEFIEIQAKFRNLCNTTAEPVFMFRLFHGEAPVVNALRLDIEDIYIH